MLVLQRYIDLLLWSSQCASVQSYINSCKTSINVQEAYKEMMAAHMFRTLIASINIHYVHTCERFVFCITLSINSIK